MSITAECLFSDIGAEYEITIKCYYFEANFNASDKYEEINIETAYI